VSPSLTDGEIETRDVFKLLDGTGGPTSKSWKSWERRVKGAQGQWGLDRFASFDGSATTSYFREDQLHPEWHSGVIVRGLDWPKFADDLFENFLFLGSPTVDDHEAVRKHFADLNFKVTGKRTLNGEDLLVLEGRRSSLPDLNFEMLITAQPDFLVMRWESKWKGKPSAIFEIKEIKRTKAGVFPSAGKFRQWAMKELPDQAYEFRLESVETLTDKGRKDWVPAWPAKTLVGDYVNGKNFIVPGD
jgi:hypothetical protein